MQSRASALPELDNWALDIDYWVFKEADYQFCLRLFDIHHFPAGQSLMDSAGLGVNR